MSRRSELWHVARGVLTSFVSRNNDIDGYWGIGVLAKLAQQRGCLQLELHLLPEGGATKETSVSRAASKYSAFFISQLSKLRVPTEWLASATITFRFPAHDASPCYARTHAKEQPFECILSVTDNRAVRHSFAWSGWCWPHGAAPEIKSTRAA